MKPFIDSGNTAWIIMASALVLLMTVPGLAFFYGGLVKRKNVLSVLMQCFISLCLVTLLWVICGYSLAFAPGKGSLAGFIGSFDWAMLKHVGFEPSPYTIAQPYARIPHQLFMIFQCMFAVITPALIIGAFAERMKFSAFLVFTVLWSLFVYAPVAHWVWAADGWLYKMGVIDFAGGIVVHINAGIAALVAALVIGKRKYLRAIPPHNLAFTVMGTALLWFGWFGFNAGSALAADGLAVNAFVVTHVAGATAALTWLVLDWIILKRPTILGVATGAIAGLAAVTPASGFIDVSGALFIGILVSIICYIFVIFIKNWAGYDDALDAFGVHGVGGAWGTIAAGLFATPAVQAAYSGYFYGGNPHQLKLQIFAAIVSALYSLIITFIIIKGIDLVIGIRVSEREEAMGLDVSEHNERAYTVLE
ncbi:MAG: ammonium transporter [Candidatus Margulisbacteria bacterium]|nr:ammonium transporter [Candidatus Margulisiibacteriota bacterium]